MLEQPALAPSDWIARWSALIVSGGRVLDLACGAGRHTLLLARQGQHVVALDRNAALLEPLAREPGVTVRVHDLEANPWPYASAQFDAIIVTNYLHRPLFAPLVAALKPGGILLYETFARGNERFGKPSNPDFLLEPGELLRHLHGVLRVIAYEDVYVERPKPALVQRICAINAANVPHTLV